MRARPHRGSGFRLRGIAHGLDLVVAALRGLGLAVDRGEHVGRQRVGFQRLAVAGHIGVFATFRFVQDGRIAVGADGRLDL